jgi:hypothetical protein
VRAVVLRADEARTIRLRGVADGKRSPDRDGKDGRVTGQSVVERMAIFVAQVMDRRRFLYRLGQAGFVGLALTLVGGAREALASHTQACWSAWCGCPYGCGGLPCCNCSGDCSCNGQNCGGNCSTWTGSYSDGCWTCIDSRRCRTTVCCDCRNPNTGKKCICWRTSDYCRGIAIAQAA